MKRQGVGGKPSESPLGTLIGAGGQSKHRQISAGDYVNTAPVAIACTVNLWKVEAIRQRTVIDPTVLALGACAVLVVFSAVRSPRPLLGVGPLLAVLMSFLPGLALASLTQPYSVSKSLQLFTLVPLLIVAGLQLVNTPGRRLAFVHVLALIGTAVALAVELNGTATVADSGRVGLQDGNPIGLARVCTIAAICLMMLRAQGLKRLAQYTGAALCMHAAVLTGSRGPIVAALVALLAALLVKGRTAESRRPGWLLRRFAPVGLFVGSALLFWQDSRLTSAYGGESDIVRFELARTSLLLSLQNPLGVGWGDLVLHMPLGQREDIQGWAQYPHNIFIEALVEGGAIALLGCLYVLWRAGERLWRIAQDGNTLFLALLVASTVGALTSGDLTGNRTIWAMVGIGMAATHSFSTAAHASYVQRRGAYGRAPDLGQVVRGF